MSSETMTVREAMREREKARKWWNALPHELRGPLGDDLVLGEFDWRDWGFESKPSRAFMNAVDYERGLWESAS
jgi:hypothetical protein